MRPKTGAKDTLFYFSILGIIWFRQEKCFAEVEQNIQNMSNECLFYWTFAQELAE